MRVAGSSPASSPAVTFMPDIVGEYRMRLTVEDDDGMVVFNDCVVVSSLVFAERLF